MAKNYRDELGIIIEGLEAGHDIIGEVQEKESDDDDENLRAVSGYEMLTSLLQQTQTERLYSMKSQKVAKSQKKVTEPRQHLVIRWDRCLWEATYTVG